MYSHEKRWAWKTAKMIVTGTFFLIVGAIVLLMSLAGFLGGYGVILGPVFWAWGAVSIFTGVHIRRKVAKTR